MIMQVDELVPRRTMSMQIDGGLLVFYKAAVLASTESPLEDLLTLLVALLSVGPTRYSRNDESMPYVFPNAGKRNWFQW